MCKTSPHLVDFQMQERRQKVTTETLLDLVWTLLKNTTFQFNKTTWKKLRGTTIAPKFVPPYAIPFMANLDKRFLEDVEGHPHVCCSYNNNIHCHFGTMEVS